MASLVYERENCFVARFRGLLKLSDSDVSFPCNSQCFFYALNFIQYRRWFDNKRLSVVNFIVTKKLKWKSLILQPAKSLNDSDVFFSVSRQARQDYSFSEPISAPAEMVSNISIS